MLIFNTFCKPLFEIDEGLYYLVKKMTIGDQGEEFNDIMHNISILKRQTSRQSAVDLALLNSSKKSKFEYYYSPYNKKLTNIAHFFVAQ
jgi:hypothetical protein